jgi:phosphotransferase system HPr (HPr) family protein
MNTPPISRVVVIQNEQGLHARPAEMFARTALRFESQVEVIRGDRRVDGKSIIDLLTMGATQGTELIVEANGKDAAEAVEALATLVDSGFHVDEGQGKQSETQPRRHDEHDERE